MPRYNDTPLTNVDIDELLKDMHERANIVEEKDVKASDTIEDLFKDRGHVIFFVRWSPEPQAIGHWTCMVRNQRTKQIYYFDSLGKPPRNRNIEKVVLKSYPEIVYNDIEFQGDTNCCGRYALLVICLNKLGYTPEQIEEQLISLGDVDGFVIKRIR